MNTTPSASAGPTPATTGPVPDRRSADLLGRLRGARLGLPARPRPGPRRDARGRPARHRARPRGLPARRARRDGRRCSRPTRLQAVGGFTPVAAARPGHDPRARGRARSSSSYVATNASTPRAVRGQRAGRLRQPPRARRGRLADLLLRNLSRISDACRGAGHAAPCCTPTSARWSRTATRCSGCSSGSSISLCLDTGHLLIGGTDPAELTRQAPDRIAHTHLKDVDSQHRRPGPRRPADLHRRRRSRGCTGRWAPATSTSRRS